jgi:hypothetical protein
VPKNNFIGWGEAKLFFQKLIQSSFNYHLKNKFHKKLYETFKKQFFELKDYTPEDAFYGDERDHENDNDVDMKKNTKTAPSKFHKT